MQKSLQFSRVNRVTCGSPARLWGAGSITPLSGFEDSDSTELAEVLSAVAQSLCRHPLNVGLASEVRSTKMNRRREGRPRGRSAWCQKNLPNVRACLEKTR